MGRGGHLSSKKKWELFKRSWSEASVFWTDLEEQIYRIFSSWGASPLAQHTQVPTSSRPSFLEMWNNIQRFSYNSEICDISLLSVCPKRHHLREKQICKVNATLFLQEFLIMRRFFTSATRQSPRYDLSRWIKFVYPFLTPLKLWFLYSRTTSMYSWHLTSNVVTRGWGEKNKNNSLILSQLPYLH